MTDVYVSSVDGNDGTPPSVAWWNGNQSTYASIGAALASLSGAGPHNLYVSHIHDFTPASGGNSWSFPSGGHLRGYSINRGTGAFQVGAKEWVAANANAFTIALSGGASVFLAGLEVNGHSGTSASNHIQCASNGLYDLTLEQCTLAIRGTAGAIRWGATNANGGFLSRTTFQRCHFITRNGTGNGFEFLHCDVRMLDCTHGHVGATQVTVLFNFSGNTHAPRVKMVGCDWSTLNASGRNYFSVANLNGRIEMHRCKISATPEIFTGSWNNFIGSIGLYGCGGGTITVPPINMEEHSRLGSTISRLSHFRTGGADDGEQANPHSWGMVTNANSPEMQLESPPITRWIIPAGSITGATLKGIFATTQCAPRSTPVNLTTDGTSTWNGTGVGTKQKITHTLSNGQTLTVYVASGVTLTNAEFWIEVSEPDQVGGPLSVRCFLMKPSTTVYVDPRLEVN